MKKVSLILIGLLLIGSVIALSVEQSFGGIVLPFPINLTIFSPIDDNIYNTDKIMFNLTADEEVDAIYYMDLDDNNPRFRRLCRDCDEYGNLRKKLKSFRDGEHNLSFLAVKEDRNSTADIFFFIDSIAPRIVKTEPRRNQFTNGSNFYIKFREENPVSLILYYNNSQAINISEECVLKKKNDECRLDVDLTSHDNETIIYWFNLTDIAGNSDESRKTKIKVDTSAPVLNNPDSFWSQGTGINKKRIYFTFNVTEENFDKIAYSYIDNKGRLREGTLCSRLKDGICEKRKSFKTGEYNLTIDILDETGNSAQKEINFTII